MGLICLLGLTPPVGVKFARMGLICLLGLTLTPPAGVKFARMGLMPSWSNAFLVKRLLGLSPSGRNEKHKNLTIFPITGTNTPTSCTFSLKCRSKRFTFLLTVCRSRTIIFLSLAASLSISTVFQIMHQALFLSPKESMISSISHISPVIYNASVPSMQQY